jgi:hypothetical protein
LDMDDIDKENALATLERMNKERKAKGPRRPNAGMIFGRMARRLGRDSGDAQLAKAGQDLIRRSYEELEESEPDSASPTNSSAQSAPAPSTPPQASTPASSMAPKPRSRPLSDLETDDSDTEKQIATLDRVIANQKAKTK